MKQAGASCHLLMYSFRAAPNILGLTNEIINVQLQSAKHCWIAGKKEKEQEKLMKVRDKIRLTVITS